jgi:hypothetical protein
LRKASEELKAFISHFFSVDTEFIKRAVTQYRSKVDARQQRTTSLLDHYVKLRKDDKLAAGIRNPNGRALIKRHLEEEERKQKEEWERTVKQPEEKRLKAEEIAKMIVMKEFKNKEEIKREPTLEQSRIDQLAKPKERDLRKKELKRLR